MKSPIAKLLSSVLLVLISANSFAAGKPNIVLITLDSARADRMGFLGSHANLTRNLDTIAAQAVVFNQACAQAPLTVSSVATILTGTYPQTHSASELGVPLNSALPYLPDLLHGHGYRTAAFVGSNSYYSSHGQTAISVSATGATPTPSPESKGLSNDTLGMYIIVAAVIIVIAIAIVAVLIVRKKA